MKDAFENRFVFENLKIALSISSQLCIMCFVHWAKIMFDVGQHSYIEIM